MAVQQLTKKLAKLNRFIMKETLFWGLKITVFTKKSAKNSDFHRNNCIDNIECIGSVNVENKSNSDLLFSGFDDGTSSLLQYQFPFQHYHIFMFGVTIRLLYTSLSWTTFTERHE